jgi:hypothetical protein
MSHSISHEEDDSDDMVGNRKVESNQLVLEHVLEVVHYFGPMDIHTGASKAIEIFTLSDSRSTENNTIEETVCVCVLSTCLQTFYTFQKQTALASITDSPDVFNAYSSILLHPL